MSTYPNWYRIAYDQRREQVASWVPVFFDWTEWPKQPETIDIECEVVEPKQLEQ